MSKQPVSSNRPGILGGEPLFDPPLPLLRPTLPAVESVTSRFGDILQSGMLTKGPVLEEYEAAIAEHLGVDHAVGVSSCTAGLLLAYRLLGLTGEVIVPSFSFMATVHPLVWNGLTPVFVDVDPDRFTIDPAAVEAAITSRTSAIVAVHVFGNPAPIEELEGIASRHGLALVFDAAHGFGALYRGRPVGRYGSCEVFSSSPTKLLVTGEGGIVATESAELAHAVKLGREYGNPGDYDSEFAGLNARLPEVAALMGLRSLDQLEANVTRRNHLAALMKERLGELAGISFQVIEDGNRSSYKDFGVVVDVESFGLSRDQLVAALLADGIPTRNYYDPPIHRHRAYADLPSATQAELPVTDRLAATITCLPCYSEMSDTDAEKVCEALERTWAHREAIAGLH